MSIRKHSLVMSLSLVMLILISACGGRATPDASATLAPMYTAAAQTLQALSTQVALTPDVPPQATPIPTPTPIAPLPTLIPPAPPAPVPPAPPAVTRCDWVGFVSDVSVPDGSSFAPSTAFTKTWRLKNRGTCTWTTAYALAFSSGSPMGGPAAVNLLNSVAPGQVVDLSVNLTAPSAAGHYRGYWMLQNASGGKFGLGAQATTAFYVDINVAAPGPNVTTTTINADNPDPSTPGQAVAVSVTVSGTGVTPTGTVAITGADTNCTITLSSGSGSCSVVFTTAGARTLTATYSGDVNYAGSSGTANHTVIKGSAATAITSDLPDPSNLNVSVTV
ncbi:MAG: NBR1-Ig-like domain-containing protein, partial [Anaerolineales bacterium]|nr:NBR1-Ig-like domain-containing protein [Anaerolineales bacterium]